MIEYKSNSCCDDCDCIRLTIARSISDCDAFKDINIVVYCAHNKLCENYNKSENDLVSKPKLAKATSGRYPWKKED